MSIDRSEQGISTFKETRGFAESFLERDLSKEEVSGLIDLVGVYGAQEVNDRLRDIIGGIREEKNVAEYLDALLEAKGLGIVDVVALDFAYGDDSDIYWSGQLDDEANLWG